MVVTIAPVMDYDRVNVRSNLDFNITKTTVLKMNLAGSNSIRKAPWSNTGNSEWQIGAAVVGCIQYCTGRIFAAVF